VINYLINERINTGPFIDRTTALYLGKTWVKVLTKEGDQRVGTCVSLPCADCYLEIKGIRMKDQV